MEPISVACLSWIATSGVAFLHTSMQLNAFDGDEPWRELVIGETQEDLVRREIMEKRAHMYTSNRHTSGGVYDRVSSVEKDTLTGWVDLGDQKRFWCEVADVKPMCHVTSEDLQDQSWNPEVFAIWGDKEQCVSGSYRMSSRRVTTKMLKGTQVAALVPRSTWQWIMHGQDVAGSKKELRKKMEYRRRIYKGLLAAGVGVYAGSLLAKL